MKDLLKCNRMFHIDSIMVILFAAISISSCASIQTEPTAVHCSPVDASSLQGTIRGTWKGIALNTAEVYGEFEMICTSDGHITGNYTGSASGHLSGCMDANGKIQASGTASGGKVIWTGNAYQSNGSLFASGTWEFPSGKGSWSGKK